MSLLRHRLREQLSLALSQLDLDLPRGFRVDASPATDPRFGDYQSNSAMILAKRLKRNPRELAQAAVEAGNWEGLCQPPEIAGPGFINFRITQSCLEEHTLTIFHDAHLGVPQADPAETIVIDFSAPNVAKPMHIGHIRSTFIGDCLSRVGRFLGHRVITDNHIGDWGTQFGMIIYGWKRYLDREALEKDPIRELLRVYREVNVETKADEGALQACRDELVKLQQGDAENHAIWKQTVDLSLKQLGELYDWLGITFDHYLGESFYNDRLGPVVDDLLEKGLAEESDGAICIFFRDIPELAEKPAIVRKRDGGFNYATSDLATIDHRISEWNADQVWYVVGAPQQLHFQQLFAAAKRRGQDVRLTHVAHGSILGQDRKLMKTRSGDNVQLLDVLHEAVERARTIIEEKNPTLNDDEKTDIAEAIGLGAVKYAELSQHRMTDYIFSWDKMLSFQGNTAPYLMNAYVRTRAIFRKLGEDVSFPERLVLAADGERTLAMKLAQFGEIVPDILNDFRPNLLANYLYELAQAFHGFYEHCPVLKSEGETRASRLLLCELTSRVLKQGLDLLGIRVTDRM